MSFQHTPNRALSAPLAPERIAARHRIEAAIEELVALLDDFDGDTDREPCLGSIGSYGPSTQEAWAAGGDCDEREAWSSDEEPSLGWTENGMHVGDDDREADFVGEQHDMEARRD